MLTHSLIQYLTLPATPPSPVALAAGVRFIHKARLYEREIKDSLSPITRIVTVCAQRQDAQSGVCYRTEYQNCRYKNRYLRQHHSGLLLKPP